MTRKRKANIRPDLIGELFTDGENYFKLLECETEPSAVMIRLSNPEMGLDLPISSFANFVQLKPVRPIEKLKKPRADLGGTHKKPRERQTGASPLSKISSPSKGEGGKEDEPEIADKKGELTIHVPTGLNGDNEYRVGIAGSLEARGATLRETVLTFLQEWNGEIPEQLNEQARATVQGILDAGE